MLSVYFKIFAKLVGDSLIKPWSNIIHQVDPKTQKVCLLLLHPPRRHKDMGSRPFTTTSTKQTHTTLSKLLNYTSWHRTYLPLQAVLDTNLRFIPRKASSRIKQYGDYIFPTHSLSTFMWANASIPNNAGYIVSTVPVICVACWRCNAVSGRTLYCRQNRRRYSPPQWKKKLVVFYPV